MVKKNIAPVEDFMERRKSARLDIPIKVKYRTLDVKEEGGGKKGDVRGDEGVTGNISAGGCLLVLPEELKLNTDIELDIVLGESETEVLKLRGSIVRCVKKAKDMYEHGISFAGMSSGAKRLFADFCFAKMYEMIGLNEWPTDKRTRS